MEEWWDDSTGPRAKARGSWSGLTAPAAGHPSLAYRGRPSPEAADSQSHQVVIEGGGDRTLACGPQKPSRALTVDYVVRADSKAARRARPP